MPGDRPDRAQPAQSAGTAPAAAGNGSAPALAPSGRMRKRSRAGTGSWVGPAASPLDGDGVVGSRARSARLGIGAGRHAAPPRAPARPLPPRLGRRPRPPSATATRSARSSLRRRTHRWSFLPSEGERDTLRGRVAGPGRAARRIVDPLGSDRACATLLHGSAKSLKWCENFKVATRRRCLNLLDSRHIHATRWQEVALRRRRTTVERAAPDAGTGPPTTERDTT